MSEEAQAADSAPAAPAPQTPETPAPAAQEQPAPTPEQPAWGDDWRDRMSRGDENIGKRLDRYRSPEDVATALINAQGKISEMNSKSAIPELSENSTDEDVAAYREAFGIPENSDDYRDAIELPEAFPAHDKELADGFMDHMHQSNVKPQDAQAALEWYQGFQETIEQDRNEYMQQHQQAAEAELRAEWGNEASGNFEAIKVYLNNTLGQETADQLRNMRAEDGSLLMNNPALLRALAQPAVDYMGPNMIHGGDVATTAKTLQERKAELLNLSLTDPVKYKSDEVQEEITGIFAQLAKFDK